MAIKETLKHRGRLVWEGAQVLPQTLGLVFAANRGWMVLWGGLVLMQGLLPVLMVWLTREVINGVTVALEGGQAFAWGSPLGGLLLLFGAVVIGDLLVRRLSAWVRNVVSETSQDDILGRIQAKSCELGLRHFESREYYDRWYRAAHDARQRPAALLEGLGALLQSGIAIGGISLVLVRYAWWLPLVLLGSVIPSLVVAIHFGRVMNRWRQANTIDYRRLGYWDFLMTSEQGAQEVRILGLVAFLRQRFSALATRLRRDRFRLLFQQMLGSLFGAAFGLTCLALLFFQALERATRGVYTLGDLGLFYQALYRGLGIMRTGAEGIGQFYQNILHLRDLVDFLKLKSELSDGLEPVTGLSQGIRLEGVEFRYPGRNQPVLTDFGLEFPAGTITAIVGDNGAGKTTITKLITRLYDPHAGRVTLDGMDLRSLKLADLRSLFSVMPQEPLPFQETVRELLHQGDVSHAIDEERLTKALREAGAEELVNRLPRGIETALGFRFGESELSGGEWQRLALARVFYRGAPIIVLDEPTSHMDSWAEGDWLDRLIASARGRTVIMITHRFTTAMRADIIHVMKSGVIVESGSHKELLAKGGLYADSWRRQTGCL